MMPDRDGWCCVPLRFQSSPPRQRPRKGSRYESSGGSKATVGRDRAGDRVLFHARCGPSGSALVNRTTATVTDVNSDGLAVRLDGSGEAAALPAAFVQGSRRTVSPNLSHAWARTVDGAPWVKSWSACGASSNVCLRMKKRMLRHAKALRELAKSCQISGPTLCSRAGGRTAAASWRAGDRPFDDPSSWSRMRI
jgi:hypothetical protein